MSHTLLIQIPTDPCTPASLVDWLLVDTDNQTRASGQSPIQHLASHQDLDVDYTVVGIVPAEMVLLTRLDIPSTQLRQIRQALPFAVEDLLADDIENIHTAIPTTFRPQLPQVDTAIINHALLIEWLDIFHSHRLSPVSLLIDVLCLPREQGSWTIAVFDQRVLVRTDRNLGVAMQFDDVELLIESMLAREATQRSEGEMNKAPPQLQVIASQTSAADGESVKTIAKYLKQQFPDYPVKATLYKQEAPHLQSFDWKDQSLHGINLLQGGYAANQSDDKLSTGWSLVAGIASVGIMLFLLVSLGAGWFFNIRADQLQAQSEATYRELFPNERRVVNPRKQLQNRLKQTGAIANQSFLGLLAETAGSIQGKQPTNPVTLTQIRFNSDQGSLRFEVSSRTLDQLDQFKTLLATTGLQVDINSASEQDGSVVGRIVVSQP